MTAPSSLGLDITPEPVVPLPPPRPRPRRRTVALVSGAVVAVLGAGVGVLALRPPPHSDEPVVLPETLLGLGPASARFDFGDDPAWQETQRAELTGAFGGRAYSPGTPITPQVNLVVNREDVTDDDAGDVAMAGEVEQTFGAVRCTQNFDYDGFDEAAANLSRPEPRRSEDMLICWRSRSDLTVSVFVLGVRRASFGAAEVAVAIDEVWALQG